MVYLRLQRDHCTHGGHVDCVWNDDDEDVDGDELRTLRWLAVPKICKIILKNNVKLKKITYPGFLQLTPDKVPVLHTKGIVHLEIVDAKYSWFCSFF